MFLGAALAVAAPLSHPQPQTLTLEAALQRALERGPVLAAAEAAAELARASRSQARLPTNPQLTIETENVFGEGAFRDFDAAETTVSLHQPVAIGGKRRARLEAADAAVAQARLGLELARRETRRDVTIAYARAVLADRLAALARERQRAMLALRDAIRRRVAVGLDSDLQLARVEVEAAATLGAVNRAQSEASIARRGLGRWLGVELVPESLDGAWFDQPAGAPTVAAFDVERHPHWLRRRAREAELEFRATLAQRAAIPDATLSLGIRRFAGTPPGENDALTIALAIPLPLWDRNAVGIAAARSELLQARIDVADARRELADDFANASAALSAAAAELATLEALGLPAARSAAALAARGHEAGRLSLLERLTAERALHDVEEAIERARYAARASRARLDYLVIEPSTAP